MVTVLVMWSVGRVVMIVLGETWLMCVGTAVMMFDLFVTQRLYRSYFHQMGRTVLVWAVLLVLSIVGRVFVVVVRGLLVVVVVTGGMC